ncbi:two-component system chemotaxis sensor kinase CheA [Melghiribacillus thermohalophilus]|uniref:Chemotaxis protein CheA n=1 Tax=Melghiribacillus thermohalophilus TaxID=1324956 RepID=A0A4V2V2W4_9BACI|nr:chemotaxis protein CheA [Melghiribacillus thermohalophilus]TCT26751.1 two-component system chemotaxis sensor kinase CheA [Melghiribacillus thermohalophilus]
MENNQYLEVFIDESKEHLQAMNDQLLELEKNPAELSIVQEIFRSAHTLKGMSATMGFEDLANLTHKMENVLDAVRNEKIQVDSNMLDIVFEAVEYLEEIIFDIAEGGDGKKDVKNIVEKLLQIEKGEVPQEENQAEVAASSEQILEAELGTDLPFNNLDEFELTVLQESRERHFNNFHIHVELREDCLLKAARVYMVFEILEQVGEVIKSIPSVEDLEEEKFDYDFDVLLVTKESRDDVYKRIMKVSEIERVEVNAFNVNQYMESKKQEKSAEQKAQMKKEETGDHPQTNTKSPKTQKDAKKKSVSKTIRVNIDRLDVLMNLFEELVIDRGRLEQISYELNHNDLKETVERMSRISSDLQNIILTMRMVPIEQVFNRFPRMVRQLARDLNKKVDFQITGQETELDRTVIDEIGDPLVHLIRNALDHGIETPEERAKKGKPEQGTLKLKAYHSGNHVYVEIEDDGQGINKEKVIHKAIQNGVITAEQSQSMTDQQIYELIMASGFSTADKISDVSGRGVGLDVVKNTIESLGGSITIDSRPDEGSLFSIQLPLTLSIISVMLVDVADERYAIPLSSIIETAIVKKEDIMHAHNKEVIDFRGKVVPLVHLKEVFEVPVEQDEKDDLYSIVIVRKGDKMAGMVVDSFIGQQEIVLKSLGNYLTNVFAISGATILGNGEVALIVDTNALIK